MHSIAVLGPRLDTIFDYLRVMLASYLIMPLSLIVSYCGSKCILLPWERGDMPSQGKRFLEFTLIVRTRRATENESQTIFLYSYILWL